MYIFIHQIVFVLINTFCNFNFHMFGSSAIAYDRTKKVHEKCDVIKLRVLVFL